MTTKGKFRAAAVQMNARVGDARGNLDTHCEFIARAAKEGCALVVFPELSVTAHFGAPEAVAEAECLDGEFCRRIAGEAGRHNLTVSFGLCERAEGTFFNTQVLMGPLGIIGTQRKTHPSGDEYLYFGRGNDLRVEDAGSARVGTLVCYDSTFPETWRVLALRGAEVILLPHASRSGRGVELPADKQLEGLRSLTEHFPRDHATHCKANAVFAVFCNQWGFNGHSTHEGGAWIVAPNGQVLVRSEPVLEDTMIVAEIDLAEVERIRRRPNCTLRTRRPELYGEITKRS